MSFQCISRLESITWLSRMSKDREHWCGLSKVKVKISLMFFHSHSDLTTMEVWMWLNILFLQLLRGLSHWIGG